MTDAALAALLGLICEDCDLLALAVLDKCSLNGSTVYIRSANGNFAVLTNEDNLIESYFAFFNAELFNENFVALFYLILLSACFDNCVNFRYLLFICLAMITGGVKNGALRKPSISGSIILSHTKSFVNSFLPEKLHFYAVFAVITARKYLLRVFRAL